MWLLKMSWLNLLRNSRRSLATLVLLSVGSAGIMVIGGFGLFSFEGLKEQSSRDTGHLLISHPKYFDEEENTIMEFGFGDYQSVIGQLKSDAKITYLLPTIKFQGLVSNDDKSVAFLGRGIDPKELRARGPFVELLSGTGLPVKPSETEVPKIMLGKGLAKILNAKPNSSLTVIVTNAEGLNGFDVEVAGTFTTGIPEYDQRLLMIDFRIAQELLHTDKVSFVGVHLKNSNDTEDYQTKLENKGLKVTNWQQLAVFYKSVKSLYTNMFSVIGGIAMLIVFFSVYNTMNMAVWERTHEIGIISTLGTNRHTIILGFMGEGLLIVSLTGLLSIIIYFSLSLSLVFLGIEMPPPPGRTMPYPLQVTFSFELYLLVIGATLLVTQVATFFASRRAANMPTVDALAQV